MPTLSPVKQSKDKNIHKSKKFQAYTNADDSEQHEIIKGKLNGLNWVLADKALEAAHGATEKDYGKVVQLCTALGISYDKAFGKREISVKPLSFPDPLLGMVRKGLLLSNDQPTAKQVEPIAPSIAPAISEIHNIHAPEPVVHFDRAAWKRRRYAAGSAEEKQARLDRATTLRHERKEARKAMIASAVQQIQADVPWQNTTPLSKGVL